MGLYRIQPSGNCIMYRTPYILSSSYIEKGKQNMIITIEMYHEMRMRCKRSHESLRAIAASMGLHRNTVRRCCLNDDIKPWTAPICGALPQHHDA